jgi:hypothetical protein
MIIQKFSHALGPQFVSAVKPRTPVEIHYAHLAIGTLQPKEISNGKPAIV